MLPKEISAHNFYSFIWHAAFLALAKNFIDIDTIIPSLLVEAGGGPIHIGILTTIMLGGSRFTQLFFAPYLSNKSFKKKYLLIGINTRVSVLIALGIILLTFEAYHGRYIIWLIFLCITIFSVTGAFSNISYTDILGKSVNPEKRKTFFSTHQIISGIIILAAAFLVKKVLVWKDYPVNYAFMLFIGGTFLLIASGGLWNIRESVPSTLKISNLKNFFTVLSVEMKKNKKLGYFLGFVNTQGIAVSFLPFVILYAKETFNTQSSETGFFLLFKVIGIVIVSILVLLGAKKIKYNILLYSNLALSILMAVMTWEIVNMSNIKYIFLIGGVVYSLYTITMSGLLLEISRNENRAVYTGFSGAGNILPAIFPLIGGTLIKIFGFKIFFVLFMATIIISAYFIIKINCKK
jgi:MFS family permease